MSKDDEIMVREIKVALHDFIIRVAKNEKGTTPGYEVQALPEVVKVFCDLVSGL